MRSRELNFGSCRTCLKFAQATKAVRSRAGTTRQYAEYAFRAVARPQRSPVQACRSEGRRALSLTVVVTYSSGIPTGGLGAVWLAWVRCWGEVPCPTLQVNEQPTLAESRLTLRALCGMSGYPSVR